jgi:hypothetical protein
MQNVVNHLAEANNKESCTPPKRKAEDSKEEPNILTDFSACMYEYEDEATFQEAFNIMRTKESKQSWLDSIYNVREKWVKCYSLHSFMSIVPSAQ